MKKKNIYGILALILLVNTGVEGKEVILEDSYSQVYVTSSNELAIDGLIKDTGITNLIFNGSISGGNTGIFNEGASSIINNGMVMVVGNVQGLYSLTGEITNNGLILSSYIGAYLSNSNLLNIGQIKSENLGVYLITEGRIENNGLIEAKNNYGIYDVGSQENNLINSGIIEGTTGVYNLENINNTGKIIGKGTNGIYSSRTKNIIENTGIIYGRVRFHVAEYFDLKNYGYIYASSEVMFSETPKAEDKLINIGVMKSSILNNIGIYMESGEPRNVGILYMEQGYNLSTLGEYLKNGTGNYGIQYGKPDGTQDLEDYGIDINTDNNRIIIGTSGTSYTLDGTEYTVKNSTSTFIDSSYENNILNVVNNVGADGVNIEIEPTSTIEVNTSDVTATNSVINNLHTAIDLSGSGKLSLTDTVVNGGLMNGDSANAGDLGITIQGSEEGNIMEILGSSVINGDVNLGDGNDTFTWDNASKINGLLDGGAGDGDNLNLGVEGSSTTLNILDNISGFENIATNGNVTLFETVSITDGKNIDIASGNLTLRLDPAEEIDGKITGHSLFGNTGKITSSGGTLFMGLNGLGKTTLVDMGGTSIDTSMDSTDLSKDKLLPNSSVLDAILLDTAEKIATYELTGKAEIGDVLINVREELPPTPTVDVYFEKQNEVYKSILSGGELGKLAPTTLIETVTGNYTDAVIESHLQIINILDQMYRNNPYAETIKSAKDNMGTIEENMEYLTIKPDTGKWITQGKGYYADRRNENRYEDNNPYYPGKATRAITNNTILSVESDMVEILERNYDVTTYSKGGLATFEYGIDNKSSIGIIFAGSDINSYFEGGSEANGDSIYLGGFAKKEFDKIKLFGGIGYQHTNNNVDRIVANSKQVLKTGESYGTNSLSGYIQGKYMIEVDEKTKIEPKIKLSTYYIAQEKVNEGYSVESIGIQADSQKDFLGNIEIGLDYVKEKHLEKAKLKHVFSIAGIYNFDAADDLTGRVVGETNLGSDFEIHKFNEDDFSGKVSYNLEYEKEIGTIFTGGVSCEVSTDGDRNLNVGIGIGYRY